MWNGVEIENCFLQWYSRWPKSVTRESYSVVFEIARPNWNLQMLFCMQCTLRKMNILNIVSSQHFVALVALTKPLIVLWQIKSSFFFLLFRLVRPDHSLRCLLASLLRSSRAGRSWQTLAEPYCSWWPSCSSSSPSACCRGSTTMPTSSASCSVSFCRSRSFHTSRSTTSTNAARRLGSSSVSSARPGCSQCWLSYSMSPRSTTARTANTSTAFRSRTISATAWRSTSVSMTHFKLRPSFL